MVCIWKNININFQNVEVGTEKALLIKMPMKSNFDGYVFWFPKRFIKQGRHSNAVCLSYNDSFRFELIKYGKGKFNKKEIIDRLTISADEFDDAFKVMDSNIVAPKKKYK